MPWTSQAISSPAWRFGFEDLFGFVVEDRDELVADDLALGLGVGDAGELGEEALAGVDGDDVEAELLAHGLLDFGELVFAQDAVVDEDAGEAVADGAVRRARRRRWSRRRRRGRRWRGRSPTWARMRSMVEWMKCSGVQSGVGAADVEDEVAQQLHALRGVGDLGVELDGPDAAGFVGDAGDGVGGFGGEFEAFGQADSALSPCDIQTSRVAGRPRKSGVSRTMSRLRRGRTRGPAADSTLPPRWCVDELQAVADAEDGHAERRAARGRLRGRRRRRPNRGRRRG